MKPIILHEGTYSADDLKAWVDTLKIWRKLDLYPGQLEEIFEIENPGLLGKSDYPTRLAAYVKEHNSSTRGDWIYFPWSGELMHSTNEHDYFRLRTNRNQNLITTTEQQKLYDARILVMGLSVGNSIANTLASAGIAKQMSLADFDDLSTANLNRVKAGISDVGKSKHQLVAEQLYNINPYAVLDIHSSGLQKDGLQTLAGKLDIIFDEIDDFAMKVNLRYFARDQKLPLIMMTSLGDNVLVDIERYDTDSTQKPFAGIVPDEILNEITTGKISEHDKVRYAVQLVDARFVPTKAMGSLLEIGKSLVGRPQLANAISIDGGLAVSVVKKIVLGGDLQAGRYYFDAAELLGMVSDTADSPERIEIMEKLQGPRES